ncbi:MULTISPECIES: hypothetical protein [unclassified Novosphingobium]|uniref:hypothetical protein n=1 Tax=unclassified Novosphingobium TaxID=2644732 RepID=UPI00146E1543|nr:MULTISPECIES: hypothetical protein [unclassified Novosphingobium]NMN04590.1 hypothetical protein [Novosphingobium sp. SG919]NMN85417.1 hypothetical protein [Novosphingobium sp. SG916]
MNLLTPVCTRRAMLGGALALAGGAGLGAGAQARVAWRPIDAVVIDGRAPLPRELSGRLAAAPASVLQFTPDVTGYAAMARMFADSQAVSGVTSGATLFCLEQIAADHGFRLTGHACHAADDPACSRALGTALGAIAPAAPAMQAGRATYNRSCEAGRLHVWTMHKRAGAPLRAARQES